uniref:ubiquitinyl hydrolase 1 n=1 Tax=Caligus rogercresseyi TaxID=217165 RepID=C1BP10_CALRO|nr:Josephin-like protein [Caligus rogercresseyi]
MYHECQSRQLCALHALNNLFQRGRTFSQRDLDEICLRLSPQSWLNPHRSPLGWGNYDVNVVLAALRDKGHEALWFDKRKDVSHLNLESVFGFILNVPNNLSYLPLFSQRHWIALRKSEEDRKFYNLDSHLKKPELIGEDEDMLKFLRNEMSKSNNELILVMKPSLSKEHMWNS